MHVVVDLKQIVDYHPFFIDAKNQDGYNETQT